MKTEKEQLIKIVGNLLNEFGSMGKYKKPYYTKNFKIRKNNEFVYPHKYELLSIMKDLTDNNYSASEVHTRCLSLKNELIDLKRKEC
jgi:hypothetical protein